MSFEAAGARIVEGVGAGLYQSGTIVMANSQPLVPVETGTLKSSGAVTEPVEDGDALVVTVGYGYGDAVNPISGEPAAGYAVYVHERLDVHHQAPTQAKFLEKAARDFEPDFPFVLERAIGEKL